MDQDDFAVAFDTFRQTAVRLECLQSYAVPSDDKWLAAWRAGLARPERSVRTSAWLRRIADTTIKGRHWRRVRIVEHPLSDYVRFELGAYVENQAVGEEIVIADRAAIPDLADVGDDFWLFDTGTDGAWAVVVHYTPTGEVNWYERVEDPRRLHQLAACLDRVSELAVPLNAYLTRVATAQIG